MSRRHRPLVTTTRRSSRAWQHALRPLVAVVVDVAVAAEATEETAAKVAAVDNAVMVATEEMAAKAVAVVAEKTVMAAKVVAVDNVVMVAMAVRAADVAVPEPVVVAAVTEPEENRALTEPEEVASPARTGSRASLARRLTQWTSKMEPAEVAEVTARTATAEADGAVIRSPPPMTSR